MATVLPDKCNQNCEENFLGELLKFDQLTIIVLHRVRLGSEVFINQYFIEV